MVDFKYLTPYRAPQGMGNGGVAGGAVAGATGAIASGLEGFVQGRRDREEFNERQRQYNESLKETQRQFTENQARLETEFSTNFGETVRSNQEHERIAAFNAALNQVQVQANVAHNRAMYDLGVAGLWVETAKYSQGVDANMQAGVANNYGLAFKAKTDADEAAVKLYIDTVARTFAARKDDILDNPTVEDTILSNAITGAQGMKSLSAKDAAMNYVLAIGSPRAHQAVRDNYNRNNDPKSLMMAVDTRPAYEEGGGTNRGPLSVYYKYEDGTDFNMQLDTRDQAAIREISRSTDVEAMSEWANALSGEIFLYETMLKEAVSNIPKRTAVKASEMEFSKYLDRVGREGYYKPRSQGGEVSGKRKLLNMFYVPKEGETENTATTDKQSRIPEPTPEGMRYQRFEEMYEAAGEKLRNELMKETGKEIPRPEDRAILDVLLYRIAVIQDQTFAIPSGDGGVGGVGGGGYGSGSRQSGYKLTPGDVDRRVKTTTSRYDEATENLFDVFNIAPAQITDGTK